jgi:hypothetical protein
MLKGALSLKGAVERNLTEKATFERQELGKGGRREGREKGRGKYGEGQGPLKGKEKGKR